MVLKIPSATSAQPYISQFLQNSSFPLGQGMASAYLLGPSERPSSLCPSPVWSILCRQEWGDSQRRSISVSSPTHLPQRGHSRRAPGLCHVGRPSEAHPPGGLGKHLPPDCPSWSLSRCPSPYYITYIVWLLLPLNNLRFLAPAWKYRAPRQSLLTWQTCYWVPHNSQGGTASSP